MHALACTAAIAGAAARVGTEQAIRPAGPRNTTAGSGLLRPTRRNVFPSCVSEWPDEHASGFVHEACVDSCEGPANCTRCSCRACAQCRCISRRGDEIDPAVCGHANWRGHQLNLGMHNATKACRHACEAGRGGCTVWMHHLVTGECRGAATDFFEEGWEPRHVLRLGVARCAAAPSARSASLNKLSEVSATPTSALPGGPTHSFTAARQQPVAQITRVATSTPGSAIGTRIEERPGTRVVVLHTVTTFAVTQAVAERIAVAQAQAQRHRLDDAAANNIDSAAPPLLLATHRVAVGTNICTAKVGCDPAQLRAIDRRGVGLLRAAFAAALRPAASQNTVLKRDGSRAGSTASAPVARGDGGSIEGVDVPSSRSVDASPKQAGSALSSAGEVNSSRATMPPSYYWQRTSRPSSIGLSGGRGVADTFDNLVYMINEDAVERAFPTLLSRSLHVRWSEQREPRWLSNGCDVLALAWYVLRGRALLSGTQHAQLWVLQQDVGWTGDLYPLLAMAAPADADLVCTDIGTKDSTWEHSRARSGSHRSAYGSNISACLLPVARFSQRLLSQLVRELHNGLLTYCESRAATACAAQHINRCRLFDLKSQPHLLGPFSYFTQINESRLMPMLTEMRGGVSSRLAAAEADSATCSSHAISPSLVPGGSNSAPGDQRPWESQRASSRTPSERLDATSLTARSAAEGPYEGKLPTNSVMLAERMSAATGSQPLQHGHAVAGSGRLFHRVF